MSNMANLLILDVSYNNFIGRIPSSHQRTTFIEGNPSLCRPSNISCQLATVINSRRARDRNSNIMIIALPAAALLSLLIIMVLIYVLKMLWKKKIEKCGTWKLTAFQTQLDLKADDVLQCLEEGNIIGKGGAGIVYRGKMPNGDNFAIKRLRSNQGLLAEIGTLGQIRHRNIVRLLGCLSNKDTNLLLYEYMPNGSLGQLLHGCNGGDLNWEMRYKIAVEAAKGLCYLHHDCSPLIIHRDVKSYNILLDSNFEAHVSDFGLAKYFQGPADCMSSLAGTFGYIAPEYGKSLKVDEKIDVYSFGVVLLELITGRKPVMNLVEEALNIVSWVRRATLQIPQTSTASSLLAIVDSRLNDFPLAGVKHMFKIAMMCVQNRSSARPTMREVVYLLTNPPPAPSINH